MVVALQAYHVLSAQRIGLADRLISSIRIYLYQPSPRWVQQMKTLYRLVFYTQGSLEAIQKDLCSR